ncbi:MAG: DUF4145 domain-containing protein [Desulfurivibrio sp.]|nr:DUF4145 domain-containing protein [Desulfurivibrio sp.]
MSKEKVKSHCRVCERETNHSVLSQYDESSRGDYAYDMYYQILECMGCDTKSFRQIFKDIEQAFQISESEWEVPTETNVYPKFIKGHKELDGNYYLPNIVGEIYKEVILAFQEDALILAGLGLRGTVEAVCNNLNIEGRNLEVRISKLATAGYISRKDAERLHGIRFMGNDAAHEIKKPKLEQLSAALKIVEHLLSTVYIIEYEIDGKIETAINEFSKFEELLKKKLKDLNKGEEVPLIGILGKDMRRIKESVVLLEQELKENINKGKFDLMKIGKVDKYNESKNDLQHYIIN